MTGVRKQYHLGAAVPNDDRFVYVERPYEDEIYDVLLGGQDVVITSSRGMGKSTIARSVQRRLRANGHATAWIDLVGDIGEERDPRRWLATLLSVMSRQIGVNEDHAKGWLETRDDQTLASCLRDYILEVVLPHVHAPLDVFLDEIDFVQVLERFTDDLFHVAKSIRNSMAAMPTGVQITFTWIGVGQPHDLRDSKETSFNVGRPVHIGDFSADEATIDELAAGVDVETPEARNIVREILSWSGGQPYLSIYLCHLCHLKRVASAADVEKVIEDFIAEQRRGPPETIQHFLFPEEMVVRNASVGHRILDFYRQVLRGQDPVADRDTTTILRMAGLVVWRDRWKVKCPIYERIFDEAWCEDLANRLAAERPNEGVRFSLPIAPEHGAKTKLIIINTGGTLGMKVEPDGRVVPYSAADLRDKRFELDFHDVLTVLEAHCQVEIVQLCCKDGANMYPDDWSAIAREIYRRRNDGDRRGVVVIHGTDTIAYTASAVAYCLGKGLDFPVVFTGSQAPHALPHGDAKTNLLRACLVALDGNIKEVTLCFGDTVFRACRTQKRHDQRFEGFESPAFRPLGYFTERLNIHKELLLRRDGSESFELRDGFSSRVLQVEQYPALNPEILMRSLDALELDGIIIKTLGVGNVPTLPPFSVLPFIEKAVERGIPVLIANQFPVDPSVRPRYSPASAPLQKGAIPVGNMTSAAAVTKFQWALAQVEKQLKKGLLKREMKHREIQRMMNADYVGEVDQAIVEKHQTDAGLGITTEEPVVASS